MPHLRRGPSGHLLRNADGHLATSCGEPVCCGIHPGSWGGGNSPSILRITFTGATTCGCISQPTAFGLRTGHVDGGTINGTWDLPCITSPGTSPWFITSPVGCVYALRTTGVPFKRYFDFTGATACDPAYDAADDDYDDLVIMLQTGTLSSNGFMQAYVDTGSDNPQVFGAVLPAGWFATDPYVIGDAGFCEADPIYGPFVQPSPVAMEGASASIAFIA